MALTLKDIARAIARAQKHPDVEVFVELVSEAHEKKEEFVHPDDVPPAKPEGDA